jgi:hypothetical protein
MSTTSGTTPPVLTPARTVFKYTNNIDAHSDDIPNWAPARPEESLTQIHIYAIGR